MFKPFKPFKTFERLELFARFERLHGTRTICERTGLLRGRT
jgi:hypothetical protein